jgi:hypothetical protein
VRSDGPAPTKAVVMVGMFGNNDSPVFIRKQGPQVAVTYSHNGGDSAAPFYGIASIDRVSVIGTCRIKKEYLAIVCSERYVCIHTLEPPKQSNPPSYVFRKSAVHQPSQNTIIQSGKNY